VTNPLRRWHTLRALVEVYSDAYNSQFHDRYLGKWKHYSKLTRETSDLLFDYGVGVVTNPIARAPKPVVAESTVGGPVAQYYFRIAWRGRDGSNGALSEASVFPAPNGELAMVSASGPAPPDVVGFDVFAGEDDSQVSRQNATVVPIGGVWTMPSSGLTAGPPAPGGQKPDYYIRRSRTR